jgi:hypothetical protein
MERHYKKRTESIEGKEVRAKKRLMANFQENKDRNFDGEIEIDGQGP